MPKVEAIQSAILSLSPEEYSRLRQWFAERDWEQWDKQIAEAAASDKLDFLVEEAMAEKAQEQLRELTVSAEGPSECLDMNFENNYR